MAAAAVRYENVFLGIIPYPTNWSRLKCLRMQWGVRVPISQHKILMSRKNGHFKMALNMST